MPRSARFWDRIAEIYSKQPIADQASYEKKLAVTRDYFRPEMEVLEIGCGTGSTALLHAPYVQHIRATDFSANMIAIAKRKAMDQNIDNVTFEQVSIDDLRVPDQSLDVVMGMSILHLLEDRSAAIAKVYKMLKPGGLFVSSTTCLGDALSWFKFIAPIGNALGAFPLLKVFKVDDLVDSLTQAGFTIEHQGSHAREPIPHCV
ncbi:MAG: class I SAM-dependent methyltransferase [Cyanobacteria bacterium P01_H01_bin.130]